MYLKGGVNSIKLLVRNERFYVGVSKVFELFVAFLLVRLISVYLAPKQFAELTLFIALSQGVTWLFISPIQNYILVSCSYASKEGSLLSLLKFEIVYSLLVAGISYWIIVQILGEGYEFLNQKYSFILFICATFITVNLQTVHPLINILGEKKAYAKFVIVLSILNVALPVLAINIFGGSFFAWLFGTLFSQLVVFFISIIFLFRRGYIRLGKTNSMKPIALKDMFSFSLPLVFALGFQWYLSQGYRLHIDDFITISELGIFLMGFTFGARFFNAIEKVFSTVFLPDLYNRSAGVTIFEAWRKYSFKMILLLVCNLLFLLVFIEWIFLFLIEESYKESIRFLQAGVLFDFLRCSLNCIFQYNLASKNNKPQLIINFISAITLFFSLKVGFSNGLSLEYMQFVFPIVMLVSILLAFKSVRSKNENC
jgi:O-antigen/teichoic acid export membrane protein